MLTNIWARIKEACRPRFAVGVHDRLTNLEARYDGVERNYHALNDHVLGLIERNTKLEKIILHGEKIPSKVTL